MKPEGVAPLVLIGIFVSGCGLSLASNRYA
jgi:hypothetical protein